MSFVADFGTHYLRQTQLHGAEVDIEIPIFHLGTADGKLFSATSNLDFAGTHYALTVDFPRDQFDGLLRVIPPAAVAKIRTAASQARGGRWSIALDDPIIVALTGRWGREQWNGLERFTPLIVTRIHTTQSATPMSPGI